MHYAALFTDAEHKQLGSIKVKKGGGLGRGRE
jgi:hypothetical protein